MLCNRECSPSKSPINGASEIPLRLSVPVWTISRHCCYPGTPLDHHSWEHLLFSREYTTHSSEIPRKGNVEVIVLVLDSWWYSFFNLPSQLTLDSIKNSMNWIVCFISEHWRCYIFCYLFCLSFFTVTLKTVYMCPCFLVAQLTDWRGQARKTTFLLEFPDVHIWSFSS